MVFCFLLVSYIYSLGMIFVVFIIDGFDGLGSFLRILVVVGVFDYFGGRVVGYV